MKTVEFFNIPVGEFFSSTWKGPELSCFYRDTISVEYAEPAKPNFLEKLICGNPPIIGTPKHHFDYHWMESKSLDLMLYPFKECIVEIFDIGPEDKATENVFKLYNETIDSCLTDNVVVFGHNLQIVNNQIVPEVFPVQTKSRHRDSRHVSLLCGFGGY